ncbi:hypothetical protein HC928_18160 [bacterium]|nr:hypothetical protein [bacterium]
MSGTRAKPAATLLTAQPKQDADWHTIMARVRLLQGDAVAAQAHYQSALTANDNSTTMRDQLRYVQELARWFPQRAAVQAVAAWLAAQVGG